MWPQHPTPTTPGPPFAPFPPCTVLHAPLHSAPYFTPHAILRFTSRSTPHCASHYDQNLAKYHVVYLWNLHLGQLHTVTVTRPMPPSCLCLRWHPKSELRRSDFMPRLRFTTHSHIQPTPSATPNATPRTHARTCMHLSRCATIRYVCALFAATVPHLTSPGEWCGTPVVVSASQGVLENLPLGVRLGLPTLLARAPRKVLSACRPSICAHYIYPHPTHMLARPPQ